MISFNDNLE